MTESLATEPGAIVGTVPYMSPEQVRGLYSYDKTPLNATTESVDETTEHWRKEKITFNAAYGNERVIAYLFLPKDSAPRYQTIAYFHGAYAIYSRTSNNLPPLHLSLIDYIIKSGRAVLFSVYKGTFEARR